MNNRDQNPIGPIKVYVVWSSRPTWIRKVAPCAYAYVIPELCGDHIFWGSGGEADCQALLTDVIIRLVKLKFTRNGIDRPLQLIVNRTGSSRYFSDDVFPWNEKAWDQQMSGRSTWSKKFFRIEAYKFELVGPAKPDAKLMERLRDFAKEKAKESQALEEHKKSGVSRRNTNLFLPA